MPQFGIWKLILKLKRKRSKSPALGHPKQVHLVYCKSNSRQGSIRKTTCPLWDWESTTKSLEEDLISGELISTFTSRQVIGRTGKHNCMWCFADLHRISQCGCHNKGFFPEENEIRESAGLGRWLSS